MHRRQQPDRLLNPHRPPSQPRRHQPGPAHRQINARNTPRNSGKPRRNRHNVCGRWQRWCGHGRPARELFHLSRRPRTSRPKNDSPQLNRPSRSHQPTNHHPSSSQEPSPSSRRQTDRRHRQHRPQRLQDLRRTRQPPRHARLKSAHPPQLHPQRNNHQRRKQKHQLNHPNARNPHPRQHRNPRPSRRSRSRPPCRPPTFLILRERILLSTSTMRNLHNSPHSTRVPHFSRPSREVGTLTPPHPTGRNAAIPKIPTSTISETTYNRSIPRFSRRSCSS